ncbi:hypothetical protein P691DRAFT_802995 [Macrolepiota fuliginosa MF-IS2]|uniref:Mid2 domain-containing protein n=1 Tax=Macrolepiota fuliginosa MF-IS2 TaxID=1400762 RepID=A0A9P5XB91_9AGAR|nr:hypothetical protein P691DRAFT_802995 [Macrolepiota fuliginosa MF-IS2]
MLFPFILHLAVFSTLFLQAFGQNSVQTFNWKFKDDTVPTSLSVCSSHDLVVFPNLNNATAGNFSGIPPYYMMAFPEGGQPITMHVGDDNTTLTWTPTHPVGTKLILQLVDSTGSTGGTSGTIFNVVENPQNNACVAAAPPSDFTISSNITQDGKAVLETCQPWRLNINGKNPPFTVVLDAKNSPVTTNISLGSGSDDAVVFINRADPGTVLFASVVDGLGRWANGTQFVTTQGSNNTDCIGLVTITTTQAQLNQQEAQQKSAQNAKRRTSIIVGVVVSVVLLLLIIGVGAWFFMRRRKVQEIEDLGQDTYPRQFTDGGSAGQVLSINNFSVGNEATPSPGKSTFSPGGYQTLAYGSEAYNESVSMDSTRLSSTAGANLRNRPSFANFPARSVRRSKGEEAAQEAMSEADSSMLTQSAAPSGSGRHPIWPARSGSLQATPSTPMESEIIYQHQDAGQVVRELPPPYIAPPDARPQNNPEQRS